MMWNEELSCSDDLQVFASDWKRGRQMDSWKRSLFSFGRQYRR